MKPTIQLKSGHFFDYTDPENSAYYISDIAWGLAHICRFSGQCNRFYSVAEHCCHIHDHIPVSHRDAGLMHDASEAFCMDVPRPLKMLLPEYKAIETRVEAAIMAKYGIPFPYEPIIKDYDNAMLLKEQTVLFDDHYVWDVESPLDFQVDFKYWSPNEAFEEFMSRAESLGMQY